MSHPTAREAEIVRLRMSGLTLAGVAGRLFLSQKTVEKHLTNLWHGEEDAGRCGDGPHTILELVAFAIDHNLVPEDSRMGRALSRYAERANA